ncbi:hypothetical protein N7495_009188 [Penicillium taxi]|uniref:uncharacterized protein n=1 Tax=Penicillium taxi TaxID=168475 RepID=UPI002545AA88|nr:uncharacterized protein N7495_009188 [Penicillium taxi]KAJ5884678.1 hypothetical protein N7495_009188 [Penicillium taxi]
MTASFVKKVHEMEFPDEPELCFELTKLPDPPANWRWLNNKTAKEFASTKDYSVDLVKAWARIYFWGIYWTPKQYSPKSEIIKNLWKLMYHTPQKYRPQSFSEFYDLNRDSGPRFIKWDANVYEQTVPISRHYPNMPAEGQPASKGFVRPPWVPDWISDSHAEQYLYPMYLPGTEPVPIITDGEPGNPATEFGTRPHPRVKRNDVSEKAPRKHVTKKQPTQLPAPPAPVLDPAERQHWLDRIDQEMKSMLYTTNLPTPHIPHIALPIPPEPGQELVKQKIEQAIMKLTYSELERHHDAPLRKPHSSSLAVSSDDLQFVQISAHPTVAGLMLDPSTLQWHESAKAGGEFGVPYQYRGRGPVWANNSCAIDSCIVAGMLLDAGCTVVDRKDNKAVQYTELERAFIEVTNMNWDVLDDIVSCQLRDQYFHLISSTVPIIKMGQPSPTWAVWAESTRNFAQFQLIFEENTTGCECMHYPCERRRKFGSCISVAIQESDATGVEISTLIERVLHSSIIEPCHRCDNLLGNITQVRVEKLPYRLVLNNYNKAPLRPLNHTQTVTFRYYNIKGDESLATYRWLGGVYQSNGHVRVFWRDGKRGERESGNLCIYDGQLNSGVIIGGVPPQHPTEQVPFEYLQDGFCLVFYERVLNPTSEALTSAMRTVQNMAKTVREGGDFLVNHKGWMPKEPQAHHPLPRAINVIADRYYDAHRNDIPRASDGNHNFLNIRDLATVAPSDLHRGLGSIGIFGDEMDWTTAEQPFNEFDSLLQSPSLFTPYPDMWPQGQPPAGARGALEFPCLPRTPTPTASQVTTLANSRSKDSRNSRGDFAISSSRVRASARSYMSTPAQPRALEKLDKSIGFNNSLNGPAKRVAKKAAKKVAKATAEAPKKVVKAKRGPKKGKKKVTKKKR